MILVKKPTPVMSEQYRILAARYRGRGWEPPPLPPGGLEAMNVLQEMVARINGREPIRIRVGKTTTFLDPKVARRGRPKEGVR